jgi:hypothetical protein
MRNPFKTIRKKIGTKIKKTAITAALVSVLMWGSVQLNIPIASDAVEALAAAISEVVIQALSAPPADLPVIEEQP